MLQEIAGDEPMLTIDVTSVSRVSSPMTKWNVKLGGEKRLPELLFCRLFPSKFEKKLSVHAMEISKRERVEAHHRPCK